jgi:hypothetical protein
LPVQRAEEVVGKRSLAHLLPGSLLNPDAVAGKVVPAAGQALVGLSLGPGQRPVVPLNAGDPVEIIYTPGAQDVGAQAGQAATVVGVIVSTQDDPDSNKTVVNVSVPRDAAVKVATWGSAAHASIALLPTSQD